MNRHSPGGQCRCLHPHLRCAARRMVRRAQRLRGADIGATSPEHAERPLAHHRCHLFHLEGYLEALKTRGRMEYDRDHSGWAADAGDVKRRKGERFSRGRPDTASKKLVRATTSPASGGRLHRATESPRRRGGLLQGGPGKTSRKVNQADRSHFQPSTLILHFSMTHTTARFQTGVP